MKSAAIESEHFILLAGMLFMSTGLLHESFWYAGIIFCVMSYAIDLVKRIKEEDIEGGSDE